MAGDAEDPRELLRCESALLDELRVVELVRDRQVLGVIEYIKQLK